MGFHDLMSKIALLQVPVPREAVGIIIGKGGDMIKTIQGKFNVRIQFQNDNGGPQRICDISGSPDDVFAAKQHVQELISDNQVLYQVHFPTVVMFVEPLSTVVFGSTEYSIPKVLCVIVWVIVLLTLHTSGHLVSPVPAVNDCCKLLYKTF